MNWMDTLAILITLLTTAAMLVMGYFILTVANSLGIFDPELMEIGLSCLESFDSMVAIMAGGYFIASILSAYFIRSHPVYFAVTLLGMLGLVAIAGEISNAYYTIATNPQFAEAANHFPLTYTLFTVLPTWVVILQVAAGAIALYGKTQSAPGGDYY